MEKHRTVIITEYGNPVSVISSCEGEVMIVERDADDYPPHLRRMFRRDRYDFEGHPDFPSVNINPELVDALFEDGKRPYQPTPEELGQPEDDSNSTWECKHCGNTKSASRHILEEIPPICELCSMEMELRKADS